jgi:hypothetical protein
LTDFFSSTIQPVHRPDEPTNDDESNDDMTNRPFTLNDGDEVSDDEVFDDNEHETKNTQHIRDNFKVDNERGKLYFGFFLFYIYSLYRNETNQMGT